MQSEKLWGEVATGAQGGNKGLKQQLLWISYNNNKELPLRAQVRMDEIILTLCPSSPRLDVLSENLGMSFKVIDFSINLDCALCSVTQLCMTLWNPMDCSPPGSSVHGIFWARILKWVAICFFRGSSQPRDWTHVSCVSCIGRWILLPLIHLGIPNLELGHVSNRIKWETRDMGFQVHSSGARLCSRHWDLISGRKDPQDQLGTDRLGKSRGTQEW